jgi:hypothetical protein
MLMRKLIRLGAIAAAALMIAVTVAPALAASEVTVGRFVQELALHRNLNAVDVPTAVDSLRAVGIRLPADLDMNARLTEGDVVSISRAIGLRVTTSNPSTPFDQSQVESFFFALGDQVVSDSEYNTMTDSPYGTGYGKGNGPAFDPFTKGKGKHKGKAKGWQSPTEPE